MDIATTIASQNSNESDLALDFSSFLLRYNRELDYSDFADNVLVQSKIKRAEVFRSWADIEDLAHGFETLSTNFESHRTTAANAFQELYQYIEKSKKNMVPGGGGGGDVDPNILRRLELVENRVMQDHEGQLRADHASEIKPRIIKDKKTNQIKLEDTLLDYMEIIISLNQKMNNHIQTTKLDLQGLESKMSSNTYLNSPDKMYSAQSPDGGKFDQIKSGSRMVHLETELEKLRLDMKAQKENDKVRQEEMENFFKKASLEYFNKLRDTSEKLDRMQTDQVGANNMTSMVGLLE